MIIFNSFSKYPPVLGRFCLLHIPLLLLYVANSSIATQSSSSGRCSVPKQGGGFERYLADTTPVILQVFWEDQREWRGDEGPVWDHVRQVPWKPGKFLPWIFVFFFLHLGWPVYFLYLKWWFTDGWLEKRQISRESFWQKLNLILL